MKDFLKVFLIYNQDLHFQIKLWNTEEEQNVFDHLEYNHLIDELLLNYIQVLHLN